MTGRCNLTLSLFLLLQVISNPLIGALVSLYWETIKKKYYLVSLSHIRDIIFLSEEKRTLCKEALKKIKIRIEKDLEIVFGNCLYLLKSWISLTFTFTVAGKT